MNLKSDTANFGIIIAFLAPGFILLCGASYHVRMIQEWLKAGETGAPTVGGFLYVTLGSIAAGVAVSAFRWLMLDFILCTIFKCKDQELNFKHLSGKQDAFNLINEHHYRYYQYYANMLIAILITYISRFIARCFQSQDLLNQREIFFFAVILIIEVVLGIGSWDARRKFYERAKVILSN